MFKPKYMLIGVLLLILGLAAWAFGPFPFPWSPLENIQPRKFSQLQIGEQKFEVVLSETPEEITQGLSDRNDIGADGMLFVLPEKRHVSFWMYHMRFALDFIWISDGRVIDLHENIPGVPASTPEREIPTVSPEVPVEMVLEVPAGFIQEKGIEEGMPITLDQVSEVRPWH